MPEKWSPEKWSPEKWSPWNSETKNRGVVVEHRGVCVECSGCDQSMKTQNLTTNTKLGNKKSCGERQASWCVCVECSDLINLWKPKTRQQIFLDSFSVLQFGAYVGSWRKRQISFCVCSGINWWKWKSRLNFLALFWRRTIFEGHFSGDKFTGDHFFGDHFSGDHFSGDHFSEYHFSWGPFFRVPIQGQAF